MIDRFICHSQDVIANYLALGLDHVWRHLYGQDIDWSIGRMIDCLFDCLVSLLGFIRVAAGEKGMVKQGLVVAGSALKKSLPSGPAIIGRNSRYIYLFVRFVNLSLKLLPLDRTGPNQTGPSLP